MLPRPAGAKELGIYHTRDYIEYVLDAGAAEEDEGGSDEERKEFGLEDVRLLSCISIGQISNASRRTVLAFGASHPTCNS